jgi:uncharacterized protein (DUF1015 family)
LATIKPFRALRPAADKAEQVSCVPYDVLQKSEARAYVEQNRLCFLRVTRPKSLYEKNERPPLDEIFERAKSNLDWFRDERIFSTDPDEAFYVYQLSHPSHTQTGIVGCCSIDEYEKGVIKRHENVRPEKVKERTGHILALGAQTGLIFYAFRGTAEIRRLMAKTIAGEPLYDFTGDDDIRQRVWKVVDTRPFVDAFAEVPSIYIADGHHRTEAARLARATLREQDASHTGREEYNYVMAGLFPAEELRILPYNRIVRGLSGLTTDEFLARLNDNFIVSETERKTPVQMGEFCMYLDRRWYLVRSVVTHVREPDPVERLDATVLQKFLLQPVLGIDDTKIDERLIFVGGARGVDELERAVDSGEGSVAFSLFPTSVADMLEVSDHGEIMPPKSTWFDPKLKDGLLVHEI